MSVNINMNLETAALPVFRLMGMAIPISFTREAKDIELVWERWHSGSLKSQNQTQPPALIFTTHSHSNPFFRLPHPFPPHPIGSLKPKQRTSPCPP